MSFKTYDFNPSSVGTTTSVTDFSGIRERMPRLSVIAISGALSVSGTSSAAPTRVWEAPYVHESDATTSGLGWELQETPAANNEPEATRRAVSDLRRISGLTWDQLGQLFAVSRRSVHFWASGKPLNAANEERLLRILDIVRAADRGNPRSTRAALFAVTEGTTPFELLAAQRFDEARALLAHGIKRPAPARTKLSAEAKAARQPLPPEALFDAQHDRVHRNPGRARAARTVRNQRRGSSD